MTIPTSRDAQMCAGLVPALGLPEAGVPNTWGTSMSLIIFKIKLASKFSYTCQWQVLWNVPSYFQVHVDINVEILDILSVNDKEFSITMSM